MRFDPGPPERRARLAAELSALRTEIAGLDVSQAPRERQARQFQLLADLGGAFELIGDRAAARELYHQAIARLPQRSETIVLYQDAGWSVGVAWVLDLLLHRLIELAENEPERSGWIARLGTIEHQRDQRQIALERWWEEQAATAPDAASGASADDRPGS